MPPTNRASTGDRRRPVSRPERLTCSPRTFSPTIKVYLLERMFDLGSPAQWANPNAPQQFEGTRVPEPVAWIFLRHAMGARGSSSDVRATREAMRGAHGEA